METWEREFWRAISSVVFPNRMMFDRRWLRESIANHWWGKSWLLDGSNFFASRWSHRRTVVPKGYKPAKNKLTWCDFTNFSEQVSVDSHNFPFRSVHALHIENFWKCCRHKYDRLISRVFKSNFWWVFCHSAELCAAATTKPNGKSHCTAVRSFAAAAVLSPSIILQYILLA